jgi:hypothetical protein
MKQEIRLIALSAAIAVNGAALFAVHVAMVDATERERLAQQEVERVVVTGRRPDEVLAIRH